MSSRGNRGPQVPNVNPDGAGGGAPDLDAEPELGPERVLKTYGPDPTDLVVWNTTRGIRMAVAAKSAGRSQQGRDRFEVTQVKLLPGLNLVSVEAWGLVDSDTLERQQAGEIRPMTRDEWNHTRARLALEAVKMSGDEQVLERLLEGEERPAVAEEIKVQLAGLRRTGGVGHRARALQDAHTRSM